LLRFEFSAFSSLPPQSLFVADKYQSVFDQNPFAKTFLFHLTGVFGVGLKIDFLEKNEQLSIYFV
jgi:hypothetical protein